MESLTARCVDAIARLVLRVDERDESDETQEETTSAQVAALVEGLELLPSAVGEGFAQRLQHHSRQLQRNEISTDQPTEAERALWAALVDHQWLTRLHVCALPTWILLSPSDVDWTGLTSLRELDLSRVNAPTADNLVAFFLESLSLHALLSLNLSGLETVAMDELLLSLATQCRRLQHLDVSFYPHASDSALSALVAQNHETLRSLRLNGLRQLLGADSLIDEIEQCFQLETLALEDCIGLTRLPTVTDKLHDLSALDFHGLTHITNDAMRVTLSGCFHQLQRLRLGESELSGESLSRLVQSSNSPTALLALDLSWCQRITSEAVTDVLTRSPSLTSLTLRCTAVEDSTLEAIGVTLTHLRVLDLERYDSLTSEGFGRLASVAATAFPPHGGLSRIEKLNLSWTSVASAAVIGILSQCSTEIRKLRLQGCKGVDGALLSAMAHSQWPRLEIVDFAWTNGVADEQLELLAKVFPRARWIGYYGMAVGQS